jgi:hypothetical protein
MMDSACARSAATLLILAVLAVLPGTAAAVGGAFFIKGGAMRLEHTEQVFKTTTYNLANVNLDDVSNRTIGIGWEIRFRHGWAVGTEYLRYDHRFTPSAPPAARGKALTAVGMVTAKKYFFGSGGFHPYVGGGLGIGGADISNHSSGGLINYVNSSFVLHAVLGIELRVDHLSFMLEAKTLAFEHRNLGYDASATGVLAGMGFNW